MTANNERLQRVLSLVLLATQILGTIVLVWLQLPAFKRILDRLGEQSSGTAFPELATLGVSIGMQIAYWSRHRYVRIPVRQPNIVLNHVFLFLSRLGFIFGSALFSVVIFRHVPELGPETDIALIARRGIVFVGSLFALFCASLEVERFGQSFGSARD